MMMLLLLLLMMMKSAVLQHSLIQLRTATANNYITHTSGTLGQGEAPMTLKAKERR